MANHFCNIAKKIADMQPPGVKIYILTSVLLSLP